MTTNFDEKLDLRMLGVYGFKYFIMALNMGMSAFFYHIYSKRVSRLETMVNYLIVSQTQNYYSKSENSSSSESESESESESGSESGSEQEEDLTNKNSRYELKVIGESIRRIIRKCYSDTDIGTTSTTETNNENRENNRTVETANFCFKNY